MRHGYTIKTNFTVIFRQIIHPDEKNYVEYLCLFASLNMVYLRFLSCSLFVISEKHLSFEKKILQFVYSSVKLINYICGVICTSTCKRAILICFYNQLSLLIFIVFYRHRWWDFFYLNHLKCFFLNLVVLQLFYLINFSHMIWCFRSQGKFNILQRIFSI